MAPTPALGAEFLEEGAEGAVEAGVLDGDDALLIRSHDNSIGHRGVGRVSM